MTNYLQTHVAAAISQANRGGKVINLHHLLPPRLNLTVPGLLGSHKAWVFYIG